MTWRLTFLLSFCLSITAFGQTVERVSVNTSGDPANGPSGGGRGISLSQDGRYVAFESAATNLAEGDRNATFDVFVHSRRTGATELVSIGYNGLPGNGTSRHPSLSTLGRYIAFESSSWNLVFEDHNGWTDVFVHDRVYRQTYCVSRSWPGETANNKSELPSISGDGRWVAFQSFASNLVPGDTNGFADIFLYDRQTRWQSRITVAVNGGQTNLSSRQAAISDSGRSIAFASLASNLVSSDTNGFEDIFVYDQDTSAIERISVGHTGAAANERSSSPSISADGNVVVYHSLASNLVPNDTNDNWDVFLFDRLTRTTERISVGVGGADGDGPSEFPDVSDDARYVTFASRARNLIPLDLNEASDIFVRDRLLGATRRASLDWLDNEVSGTSYFPSISGDGRDIGFTSDAHELSDGDSNGTFDVFVRDGIEVTTLGDIKVGSPIRFRVRQAVRDSGDLALVLISTTGQSPWNLPGEAGLRVPLTPDAWTQSALGLGAYFSATVGSNGEAITAPLIVPAVAAGQTIFGAAVTLNVVTAQLHSTTGPLVITVP